MFLMKVLSGRHVHGGNVYSKGETFESPWDLRDNFKNKFELVGEGVPAGFTPPPVTLPAPKAETAPETAPADKPAPKTAPDGADVTAKFPKASEQDYKVYKSQGQYYVYDADDPTAPLNAEGVDKKDVGKVIDKALAK